jgi:alpha-tubulin suppressor-like RCC1 family protein/regulation of enolase protein 1 (concanavalin A-like superfamily)
VQGAGADISGATDQFHFMRQSWQENGVFTVKVDTLSATNSWAKAGIMIRDGVGSGALNAAILVTPGNGVTFQRRKTANGSTVGTTVAGIAAPVWLKLHRYGNLIYASYSNDGLIWTIIGSDTVEMPADVQVGLALTSHATSLLATAVFSHLDFQFEAKPGGLWAEYFNGIAFNAPVLQRIDSTVDFSWSRGAPAPQLPIDYFSVRWTGWITPDVTQDYTFYTVSDDGVRLWVNDQQLVNNWTNHGITENSGTILLEAGVSYPVKMEYYENAGGATVRLRWSAADRIKAPILGTFLSPTYYPDADADGIPDYWEKRNGLNPNDPGDASLPDPRSTELTYLQSYLIFAFPDSPDTDGDAILDIADPYPADYYNSLLPEIAVAAGDGQAADAGQWNSLPLEASVSKAGGSVALVNAPVTFTVTSGAGSLSTAPNDGTGAVSALVIRTDEFGIARVFYRQPVAGGVRSVITASAAGATATFTSTSRLARQVVTAGGDQSFWVDAVGQARGWGRNDSGQLGLGDAVDRERMAAVPGLGVPVLALAPGQRHTLAMTSDGRVHAWGDNYFGQLGTGTRTGSRSPSLVVGLAGIIGVAAGDYHSLALKDDGTVWAWGGNQRGQLGDGSAAAKSLPVAVPGLDRIVAIAAAAHHSIALGADGRVWAWGANDFGQLGESLATERLSPQLVAGLAGIVQIASGRNHVLALDSAGTVRAWGANQAGQLGSGSYTGQVAPQLVSSIQNIRALAAGSGFSLALEASGFVWSWGANDLGQLGDDSAEFDDSIPAVLDLSLVLGIAAGGDHALALREDGTLLSWGLNHHGQLGAPSESLFIRSPQPVTSPEN